MGIVGRGPVSEDEVSIEKHIRNYFRNVKAGTLFEENEPNALSLDYVSIAIVIIALLIVIIALLPSGACAPED